MLAGEVEMDFATEVRSVIECILNDWLRPAIRDLAAAASYQPKKKLLGASGVDRGARLAVTGRPSLSSLPSIQLPPSHLPVPGERQQRNAKAQAAIGNFQKSARIRHK